jgi:hypothetical protein
MNSSWWLVININDIQIQSKELLPASTEGTDCINVYCTNPNLCTGTILLQLFIRAKGAPAFLDFFMYSIRQLTGKKWYIRWTKSTTNRRKHDTIRTQLGN